MIGGNGGSGTLNSWSSTDGIAWSDAGAIANETSRSGMGGAVLSNRIYIMVDILVTTTTRMILKNMDLSAGVKFITYN